MPLYEVEIHVARARLLLDLGFQKEASAELERAEDLCADAAYYHGNRYWPPHIPVPVSPELRDIWDFHYSRAVQAREWDAQEEAQKSAFLATIEREPAMVYCPSGHNAVFSPQGYDECAACGAVMTADAEESYFDSLCAAGQCM
jgi:hypothetical protein